MNAFTLLYFFWFILNTYILYVSTYPQKISHYLTRLPFIDVHWNKFFEYSEKIYLISGNELIYYDISEYILALIVPLFVNYLYKTFKPRKKKYRNAKSVINKV